MSEQMDFADGKYTIINDNGNLTALRNGEPWGRDLVGDNLVYWMLVEALRLKAQRDALLAALRSAKDLLSCADTCSRNNFSQLAAEEVCAIDAAIAKAGGAA